MAGITVSILFWAGIATRGDTAPGRVPHVRTSSEAVRALLECGHQRSPAFRSIADAIERRAVIVYIEPAVKLEGGREGELLHTVMGSRELPILRVLLKTNLASARAIAIIAHELQHVIEAVGGGLEDAAAMSARFARLDRARGDGSNVYETEAAQQLQARVLDDLRRSGRCEVKRN